MDPKGPGLCKRLSHMFSIRSLVRRTAGNKSHCAWLSRVLRSSFECSFRCDCRTVPRCGKVRSERNAWPVPQTFLGCCYQAPRRIRHRRRHPRSIGTLDCLHRQKRQRRKRPHRHSRDKSREGFFRACARVHLQNRRRTQRVPAGYGYEKGLCRFQLGIRNPGIQKRSARQFRDLLR